MQDHVNDYNEKWYKEARLIAGKQYVFRENTQDLVQSKLREQISHQLIQVTITRFVIFSEKKFF